MRHDPDVPDPVDRDRTFLHLECHAHLSNQYRKWEKALLLSAIRWVSSLRLTAPPVFWAASRISNASFSDMLFPPRWRAKRTIQRRASASRRSGPISTGTRDVGPPTPPGFTSSSGGAVRSAHSKTSRASLSARLLPPRNASYA